jgi:hypothetical protein
MIIAGIATLIAKLILWTIQAIKNHLERRGQFQLAVAPPAPFPSVFESLPPVTKAEQQESDGRYDLRPSLLTEAEQRFSEVLDEAVRGLYRIERQVQLSRIVEPKDSHGSYTNYSDFNRIKAKSIDFVLYDRLFRPYLCIELDDSSHFRWDRIQRDIFVNDLMKSVHLRILHIPVAYEYDVEELRRAIFPAPMPAVTINQ